MGRMHLFELEDKSWCPRVIRETTTDFLLGIYNVFNIYEPAYEKIVEILDKTGSDTIIDCCSGSGGPIRRLRDHLDKSGKSLVVINLTDKYPNASAFASLQARYRKKLLGMISLLTQANFRQRCRGCGHSFPHSIIFNRMRRSTYSRMP